MAVELPIGLSTSSTAWSTWCTWSPTCTTATPASTTSRPIPDDVRGVADEYHDKLMDIVAETSDELMERYLEGDEITREEMAAALKKLVTEGELFPVGCGAATRNIGSHGLLDLIVEGLPSPARARNVPEVGGAATLAYVFKTIADPYSGKINLLRVFGGAVTPTRPGQQPHPRQGAVAAADAPGQGPRADRRAQQRHDRRGREAQGDGHRRRAGRR